LWLGLFNLDNRRVVIGKHSRRWREGLWWQCGGKIDAVREGGKGRRDLETNGEAHTGKQGLDRP
jgi:hypothetical protein